MINVFGAIEEVQNVIDSTLAEMRSVYLRDTRIWIIMCSFGKDSASMLDLVWRMVSSLKPEERIKPVHVVIGSTLVEAPSMEAHVRMNVEMLRAAATQQSLPIYVHVANPKLDHRFFVQVLGYGNPPPNEKSKFRWCTDDLKISSTDAIVRDIMSSRLELDQYDAVMLLGVRSEESDRRRRSIEKHAIDETKFATNVVHPRVLVYHPIRDLTTDDIWYYLLNTSQMAWGADPHELYALYYNSAGECPMTSTNGRQSSSCGGSRFGCWTCCYNGPVDKMLNNLYESGENETLYLIRWKYQLYHLRNDARFRLPLRKRVHHKVSYEEDMVDLEFEEDGEQQIIWNYQPGPISIAGRKLLLEGLLHAEQITGYQLIEPDETQYILELWAREEFRCTLESLTPMELQIGSYIVLKPNGDINLKESKNRDQLVLREFEVTPEELVQFQKSFNKKFDGRIWIPSRDRRRVKEYRVVN